MAYDIGPKIGIDGEADFRKAIQNINTNIKTLGTEMLAVTSAYDANDKSVAALTSRNEVLVKQIDAQKEKLAKLQEGLAASVEKYGESDEKTQRWQQTVNKATAELNKLERQLDQNNDELASAGAGLDQTGDSMDDLGNKTEETEGKLSAMTVAMGNLISAGIEAAVSAVGDMVSSLVNLDKATEEYRAAQGKLQTAYEAAGYSSESAQTAYREFYKILGDTDTAVEASQLLAKLVDDERDLTEWTRIAAGVSGTFGDSLPIEGLIEAANETAKVGEITGSLADALNWAGISENEFNEKLAGCSDESERNRLIMETLSGTYNEASDAFYRNNESIVAARDAQASLDDSLGRLGESVANIKNSVQADFMPSITQMLDGITALASGNEGGVAMLTQGITDFANNLAEKAPLVAEAGGQLIGAVLEAISASLPSLLEAGGTMLAEIVSGILTAIPNAASAGAEMVVTLAGGVSDALPELIPAGVDVVLQIVETLTNPDSLNNIIEAALQLITSLAEGLIKALPKLAERTPQIIVNITTTLASNLPKITESALKIITTLAQGLIKAIPELVKSIPQIVMSIVNGFTSNGPKFLDIGKNIVRGVWDGIVSLGNWIREKVSGFFSGIVDSVKGLLGIHSPSKVFAGIGGYMAEGLGEGFSSEMGAVERQIKRSMSELAGNASASVQVNGTVSAQQDGVSPGLSELPAMIAAAVHRELEGMAVNLNLRKVGELTSAWQANQARAMGV